MHYYIPLSPQHLRSINFAEIQENSSNPRPSAPIVEARVKVSGGHVDLLTSGSWLLVVSLFETQIPPECNRGCPLNKQTQFLLLYWSTALLSAAPGGPNKQTQFLSIPNIPIFLHSCIPVPKTRFKGTNPISPALLIACSPALPPPAA